jgi:hypothetical protein
MKLYTNIMPFSFMWGRDKPVFIPVGTTFAAIGADLTGVIIEQVSNLNKDKDSEVLNINSVNPDIFKIAFKEVEHLI